MNSIHIRAGNAVIECRPRTPDPLGREVNRPTALPLYTYPGGRLYTAAELFDLARRNGWKVTG